MATPVEKFANILANSIGAKHKLYGTDETVGNHKKIMFTQLNCEEIIKLGQFIKTHFSTEGRFSHLLPNIQAYNKCLALSIDGNMMDEFLKKF